tara:strand:- start:455 stop:961 length:507 start_codon:yes stop_codon:yes gene_type:complete
MKKYIVLFFLIFITNGNSEQIIAYVDIDKIMKTSLVGKSVLKEIENKVNSENKKFTKIEEQIKKEEKDLNAKKNVYSKDEFEKKFSVLKSKVNKYNIDKKNSLNEINKLKISFTNKMLSKMNPLIANYASEKNISIIIRKEYMVMGKTELDISDDILKIMNSKIKALD